MTKFEFTAVLIAFKGFCIDKFNNNIVYKHLNDQLLSRYLNKHFM